MAQLNPLRPITQRLNSTPVEELSRNAGFLAAAILNCSESLQLSEQPKSDAAIQVQKLTTRISSLLQDRTQEARCAGIVLAKAVVEAAGPHILGNAASSWVRNLLSCLNKPDVPEVKKLAIVTITRIFLLTQDNQALIREITTPSLPAYMTACLNNIKPVAISTEDTEKVVLSPLLQPVLQCWLQVMRCFPATLRPFAASIRAIVLSVVSQQTTPQSVKELAFQVFALLHLCAPKDASANDWTQSVQLVIEALHQTADIVLRSVLEEWSSVIPRHGLSSNTKLTSAQMHFPKPDAVGLEKWVGMHSGCSRVVDLLQLLCTLLTSRYSEALRVPLGQVFDVTTRFAAVLWPTKVYALRENKNVGKDEREELFTNLPRIHCAILELYSRMAIVFDQTLAPISRSILSQIWGIIHSEFFDGHIRSSVYTTMKILLQHNTIFPQAQDAEHIAALIRRCCGDLKATDVQQHSMFGKPQNNANGGLDLGLRQKPKAKVATMQSALFRAAWNFLPVALESIPAELITSSTRAEIDRTAILTGHEDALLASVLHPSVSSSNVQSAPSVLPFLSRLDSDSLAHEALVRPRMPILHSPGAPSHAENVDDSREASVQDDVDIQETNPRIVSDHVKRQLEDDPIMTNVLEPSLLGKRNHSNTEDDSLRMTTDSSKRPKTSPILSKPDLTTEDLSEKQSQNDAPTIEFPQNGLDNSTQAVKPVEHIEMKAEMSVPNVTIPPSQALSRPKFDQGHESDDSEIPQIDATLSSDEDEEDDADDV